MKLSIVATDKFGRSQCIEIWKRHPGPGMVKMGKVLLQFPPLTFLFRQVDVAFPLPPPPCSLGTLSALPASQNSWSTTTWSTQGGCLYRGNGQMQPWELVLFVSPSNGRHPAGSHGLVVFFIGSLHASVSFTDKKDTDQDNARGSSWS